MGCRCTPHFFVGPLNFAGHLPAVRSRLRAIEWQLLNVGGLQLDASPLLCYTQSPSPNTLLPATPYPLHPTPFLQALALTLFLSFGILTVRVLFTENRDS